MTRTLHRLMHAPLRDLTMSELVQALHRGYVSERFFRAEVERRAVVVGARA